MGWVGRWKMVMRGGAEGIGSEKGWEKPYNWEGGGGKGESLDITISLLKRLSQIT